MRHFADVCKYCLPADVHTQPNGKFGRCLLKLRILQHLAELYPLQAAVGNLDANRRFARNRLDAYRGGRQLQRNILRKIRDLAHLDAGRRFKIITCHRRSVAITDDLRIHMKTLECLLQDPRILLNFLCKRVVFFLYMFREDVRDLRELIGTLPPLLHRSNICWSSLDRGRLCGWLIHLLGRHFLWGEFIIKRYFFLFLRKRDLRIRPLLYGFCSADVGYRRNILRYDSFVVLCFLNTLTIKYKRYRRNFLRRLRN